MKSVLLAIAAALATSLVLVQAALAVDPPDTLQYEAAGAGASPEVTAYRDLLETGDLLVVGQYNIAYSTLPTDGADVNFIGRVHDGTTAVGSNVPYPYNDDGYGRGVISFYLTQAETEAQGWTDSAGAWQVWSSTFTDLGVTLDTNPTVFDAADQRSSGLVVLDSGDFSTSSGQTANQTQLANKIIAIASGLQAAWGVVLLDDNGRLNTTGGQYFQLAIPGSLSMAPNAFGSSSVSPTIPTPVPTPGGAGTLSNTAENRFSGTFWLTPAFDSTGQTLGLPAGAFEGILTAAMILVVTGIGFKTGGSGGAAMGFAVGAGVVLPVFVALGFVAWGYGVLGIAMLVLMAIVKVSRDQLA